MDERVYIRTDRGLWRAGRCGYAESFADAGLYDRAEAEHLIQGLGPEKQACLVVAPASNEVEHG